MNENEMLPLPNVDIQATPPVSMKGSNGVAVAALITGILSFFILILIPVAIILGIIGWHKANKIKQGKGKAIAGLILGLLALCMIPLLLMGLNTARALAKNAISMTNLNRIGIAMEVYKSEYKMYPDKPCRLVSSGCITVRPFSNPKSDKQAAYHNGEVVTDGYVFIMPGKDSQDDDIVIYENEKYAYKGMVAVLSILGEVKPMSLEELCKNLTRQQKRRGKIKEAVHE